MLGRLCPSTVVRTVAGTSSLVPSSLNVVQVAQVHHHKERHDLKLFLGIKRSSKAKANRNTHVNEKMFRRMRGRKTVLIDLPEDEEQRKQENFTPSEMRAELLKKGVNPYKDVQPRSWQESQITMQSFNAIVDPYVAPEDPLPFLSMGGGGVESVKMKGEELKDRAKHKWHNWQSGTKAIRKKEGFEKFDAKTFGPTADLIYEEAHKALMKRDKQQLHKYITEHAYVKMWPDVEQGSIVWELIEHVQPSKVVTIRCSDVPYKSGNHIAQLTVRMHTKQKLAVYDRFGHLLLGSETEPKEVVEYVVFENHIAVVDGTWRLHDKVYPRWSQPKDGAKATHELKLTSEGEGDRPEFASNLPLRAEQLAQQRAKELKDGKKSDDE